MKKIIFIATFILSISLSALAQVTVSPDNITAYSRANRVKTIEMARRCA